MSTKGIKMSDEQKQKLRNANTGKKHTTNTKAKMRNNNIGNKNPMFGKSFYDIWVEKHGKEIADKKLLEFKQKRKIAAAGKNNPMYGKPSPQGSGNGWSGWYKGIYFRSLKELSYIKFLLDNDIKFKSAEKIEFRVQYKDINENIKNYYPDFYLEDSQEIIEIKPERAAKYKNNQCKFLAAEQKFGDKFKVLTEKDIHILNNKEIDQLYKSNDLKWNAKYEGKYNEKRKSQNK